MRTKSWTTWRVDRLRAVRLYIKLGKRVNLTIRQLGYPAENALKGWYREYQQRGDLPAGYVREPMYSQAQKDRAVEHYLEHGRCTVATIKSLGHPSRDLLSAWIEQVHQAQDAAADAAVHSVDTFQHLPSFGAQLIAP